MHSWASVIHGVKNHKITGAIPAALEPNNGKRVTRFLKVNRWQKGFVDIRPITDCISREISLDSIKEDIMSTDATFFVLTERLNGTVDL